MGTYPSMTHILSGGYEYSNKVTIGQWFHDAWTSDTCKNFYATLKEYGYSTYLYAVAPVNLGIKSETLSYFANEVRKSDYEGTYTKAATGKSFGTRVAEGLTVVPGKRFIIQHLSAMHEPSYEIDEDGVLTVQNNSDVEWLNITKEYLAQLKAAGVYDNSTIIICGDHGVKNQDYLQPVFLIKEAGKTGTKLKTTNAPASHCELPATILKNIGVPDSKLPGKTIYDFKKDEERERSFYLNRYNKRYAKRVKYNGRGEGSHNVWWIYTYTGDSSDLKKEFLRKRYKEIRMNQSFN